MNIETKTIYGVSKFFDCGSFYYYSGFDIRYTFKYIWQQVYISVYFIFWVELDDTLTYARKYDNMDKHSIKIDEDIWENFIMQYSNGYEKEKHEYALNSYGITRQNLEENIIKVAGV